MKKKVKLACRHRCTGCMACVDACPYQAIVPFIATDGHYYVRIDDRKCIGCGLCQRICPVVSEFSYRGIPGRSKPYVAWANDDVLRAHSTSGGIFAALAAHMLARGGVVVGVAMDDSVARHIMIDDSRDLRKLQGSKYQQSDASGIYKSVREELLKGRPVLFSGTGCQVGGLYSFLGEKTYDNLLTVDLICAGVPSRLLVEKYLERVPGATILAYRDKKEGWIGGAQLTCIENGRLQRNSSDAYFIGAAFFSGLTSRYSCGDCPFAGLYRKADITLGDFWGETDFPTEHEKGVSFMTVHTPKGEAFASRADITRHETTWAKGVNKNPRMAIGNVYFSSVRFERLFISWLFAKCSFPILSVIYAGKSGGVAWLPYKAYRFALWKWNAARVKRRVGKILQKEGNK